MNKSEKYEAITELTLLASRLRRRRDAWKQRCEQQQKTITTLNNELRDMTSSCQSLKDLMVSLMTSNMSLQEKVNSLEVDALVGSNEQPDLAG